MRRSICVIYSNPASARRAYRVLMRSPLGLRASSVTMHHRRILDGRLTISQMRPSAGAVWGAVTMAAFGGAIVWVTLGSGPTPAIDPWLGLALGTAFGGGVGALAGGLIGTTEPEKPLSDASMLLTDRRAAIVAEFDDRDEAAGAKRMLMGLEGADPVT